MKGSRKRSFSQFATEHHNPINPLQSRSTKPRTLPISSSSTTPLQHHLSSPVKRNEKRSFADFQTQHQDIADPLYHHRSVKPKTYSSSSTTLVQHQLKPQQNQFVCGLVSSPSLSGINGAQTEESFDWSQEIDRLLSDNIHDDQGNTDLLVKSTMQTPTNENLSPLRPVASPSRTSPPLETNWTLEELERQFLADDIGDTNSLLTNTNDELFQIIQSLTNEGQIPKPAASPSPISSPVASPPLTPIPVSSPSPTTSAIASPIYVATSTSKQTIIEAASAASEGKTDVVVDLLTRLSQASNSKGSSKQRLMEYMCSALKSRVNPIENSPPVVELFGKEHVESTNLLYHHSPCFKLAVMAANLAILDATIEQKPPVYSFHVIDFDVGQGGQYTNLLRSLSLRLKGKPCVMKITALIDKGSEKRIKLVGENLSQLAERVGVCLNFNVVVSPKLTDLNRDSLGCEPEEPLVVNLAFKMFQMLDETVTCDNVRDQLLRQVKGLSPRVVTLVEQEINTNTAPFMARVNETYSYYEALFDSIDSTVLARDDVVRVKVEEGLRRKLVNSIACEGMDRVERCEVFGKWKFRMSMADFELKPMRQKIVASMTTLLSYGNRVNPGFTVKEENGGVCFGWMGRTLTVASAWI